MGRAARSTTASAQTALQQRALGNKNKNAHHKWAGKRVSGAADPVLSVAVLLPLPLRPRARLPARIAPASQVVPAETVLHVAHQAHSCIDALAHEQRVLLQPSRVTAVHNKALSCKGVSREKMKTRITMKASATSANAHRSSQEARS